MEEIGKVYEAKTHKLNSMYVYHSVRKPGFVWILQVQKRQISMYTSAEPGSPEISSLSYGASTTITGLERRMRRKGGTAVW